MRKAPTKRPGPAKGTGGRPPKPPEARLVDVGLRVSRAMLDRIEAVAAAGAGASKDRSEVMRELLDDGLKAREKKGRKP